MIDLLIFGLVIGTGWSYLIYDDLNELFGSLKIVYCMIFMCIFLWPIILITMIVMLFYFKFKE